MRAIDIGKVIEVIEVEPVPESVPVEVPEPEKVEVPA